MKNASLTPDVIEKAKQGDALATSTIYQTFVVRIHRYIAYRVGSPEDAEDLTAEVFVRMVEALPNYIDTGVPFEAWLYRIASARVADFHRKRNRRTEVELVENFASEHPEPEEDILDEQDSAELRAAIQYLTEEEQTILLMRFVERKSHQEVADLLEKSISAVKSSQHRALVKLAGLLGLEDKVRHYLRGRND